MNWLASQTLKTRLTLVAAALFLVGAVVAIVLPDQRRLVLDVVLGLAVGVALEAVAYGLARRYARRRSGAAALSAGSPEMVGLWVSFIPIGLGLSTAAQWVDSTDLGLVLSGAGIAILFGSVVGNATVIAAQGQATGKGEA